MTKIDGKWQSDPEILDERYLAVKVKGRGVVVFSSCSHAGKTIGFVSPKTFVHTCQKTVASKSITPEHVHELAQRSMLTSNRKEGVQIYVQQW